MIKKLLLLVILSTASISCFGADTYRIEKNVFGGYNIYKNGKLSNTTKPNVFGSQNVYDSKGKLSSQGQKFNNTKKEYYLKKGK